MRLACIYLPALPLQVEALHQPDLAGRPLAILGMGSRAEVVACSREAFRAGVRPGVSPSQARARIGDLALVPGSPRRWREAIIHLAGDLEALAAGEGVDLTEALTAEGAPAQAFLFLAVPTGQRSDRFARRLLDAVAARGLRGRVGVAADRFTARAAARAPSSGVNVVTRARAAAFLAPLPIELLPLREEVRALLRAAGIGTLGEFAGLPPPSAGCRSAGDVDYQALARGSGPSDLHPTPIAPRAPTRPAPTPRRRTTTDPRQLRLAS
jgi:nucleotidyltransferase/DNA polymerase involved in DNA repair